MVEVTKSILARRVSSPNKIRSMYQLGILFRLFVDSCRIAFGGVTRLCLENLRFGESDIPNVLKVCKGLKHLSLSYCNATRGTIMKVEHSKLSELLIFNCCFEKVELNSLPKLIWMIFGGWKSKDPLFLGYVPLLEAVSLSTVSLSHHKMVKLTEMFGGTSPRSLRLGFECERIWVQPESVTKKLSSVFHQLKFVNLDNIAEGCDLTWTLFILEAAPNLKELYLMVWDHLCIMTTNEEEWRALSYSEKKGVEWKSPGPDFQQHSLDTLVIFGFQSDCMVRYVRRVIEAAVNLKDVFLYHRLNCMKCEHSYTNRPLKYPSNPEQKSTVLKKLTKRINSSATIHLPDDNITADQRAKKAAALQCMWSPALTILYFYALLVGRSYRTPRAIAILCVGDWITGALTFTAACASAGITTFISDDVEACYDNRCPCFMAATAMAFLSWFTVAPCCLPNLFSILTNWGTAWCS
ncbi:uncharacterized protein [Lolium perenne]|uniref:uncharacterized protein n=1 Tax=Lolium perenne TaxID=4522 RepID=UPI003A9949D2